MKHIIIPIIISLALNGCTNGMSIGLGVGGVGKHIGLGTSVNIPITPKKSEQTEPLLANKEQKILAYFNAQEQNVEQPSQHGFYRQLIAKETEHTFWVQDFYQSGEKRTEPMLLTREQLFTFRAYPHNGSYTVYAINGHIMQQQNFRDGQVIKIQP